MKEKIYKLATNDEKILNTIFLKFIQYFESEDESQIEKKNKKL